MSSSHPIGKRSALAPPSLVSDSSKNMTTMTTVAGMTTM